MGRREPTETTAVPYLLAVMAFALVLLGTAWGYADEPAERKEPPPPPAAEPSRGAPLTVVATGRRSAPRPKTPAGRPASQVTRRDMEERLPRSAPDALRYEPGVYIQQSAHAQGSAYIRGRTGQQTVLLFDGIRLNNSTYRQGPNQYFFTIDSHTVHAIDVMRGGASTAYGSDAIGGVLSARPVEPALTLGRAGLWVRPRSKLRMATADGDIGTRLQVDTQISERFRFLAGAGIRRVGRLESGGPVRSPETGEIPQVPAFYDDGRSQLGTGFREITADGRAVFRLAEGRKLTAAAYLYRQLDAPRTDQCPPPFAPRNECLVFQQQYRTLAYLAFDGDLGRAARQLHVAASYQRQHERRVRHRPSVLAESGGRDDVNTVGLMAQAQSGRAALGSALGMKVSYGGDIYFDWLDSAAWTEFTDIHVVVPLSRGQYIAGSAYAQGGAYAQVDFLLPAQVTLRAGGRAGGARAVSPPDPESGTLPVDGGFFLGAGHAGVEWRPHRAVSILANADRSVRAPNLDDLTSRQQAGPGFQFENAALTPEIAYTLEGGLRLSLPFLEAETWVYRSIVTDAITRILRNAADCPPETPQCLASWSRYQLVNARELSMIDGVELAARAWLPGRITLRATLAYAFGEGPNPQGAPANPAQPYEPRVPLSRIPPLNGTAEARWTSPFDVYAGASLRWAVLQDRLAPSDRTDARIPVGGTPGYTVVDLRAGYRLGRKLVTAIVIENIFDAAYRTHGSSVNGPGRGVIFSVEAGR